MKNDRRLMVQRLKRWWWVLLLVPLLAVGGFWTWAVSTPRPMVEAEEAIQSTPEEDGVAVTAGNWLTFRPAEEEPVSGLIFYPGGRVDPRAHAPSARAIAAEGHLVAIVPMPLNFALFAPDRAEQVVEAFPSVSEWAVGGHSLGGAMAARYPHRHPSAVGALILWAAYPAESDDLSRRDVSVLSVYGTRDGLATLEEIEASRQRLPQDTTWVRIEGGNHAQFGWYGSQRGDDRATISRGKQQAKTVEATVALLRQVHERRRMAISASRVGPPSADGHTARDGPQGIRRPTVARERGERRSVIVRFAAPVAVSLTAVGTPRHRVREARRTSGSGC